MILWLARDKQDYLGLYYKKPNWRKNRVTLIEDWHDSDFLGYLDYDEFPEVTFENSPMQVELTLKNKYYEHFNPRERYCK